MQEIKFINTPNIELNDAFDRYEPIMGNDYMIIDWLLGNTCNYKCTYCHETCNGGDKPWPDVDIAFKFVQRATDHYRSIGKRIVWNLLGGEPTVWPKFRDFFSKVKEYDPDCIIRVLTNGSRTISWWERNAHLFDEVIISWHPEQADYVHCCEVSNILVDSGAVCSIQVSMYPPYAQKCIDAAKYFHENSRSVHVAPKSLQETICDDRTMVYEQEFLDEIMKYEGIPAQMYPDETDDEAMFQSNLSKKRRSAYGKMMRFMNTHTGKQELVQANELMANGRNSWKGWMCNIGIETIVVHDGVISSGSSCFIGLSHGHMEDPDNIEFPSSGRICEYDWCSCIADVEVTKYRVE